MNTVRVEGSVNRLVDGPSTPRACCSSAERAEGPENPACDLFTGALISARRQLLKVEQMTQCPRPFRAYLSL